ncbi:MAG: hypothetical protein JO140_00565 [Candidatus Eremiobacteraeota bacterium]|nr:hypothetical protein [Candidatus Eremiobacteraeota bacterium]
MRAANLAEQMAFGQQQLSIDFPRSLRDALGLSFTYREQVRWLIGTSPLLALAYTHVPRDARIVDAREIHEFRASAFGDESKVRFGAFAPEAALRGHPLLERTLFAAASPAVYLAISDAVVEVISLGRTRTTPVDALVLASHEVPLAIELAASPRDVLVQRRRAIRDGDASHELIVAGSFRLADDGSLERVRIALSLDGERPVRARLAEHHLERHHFSSERAGVSARLCAEAIAPDDARTAAAARSALTLGLALFREARIRCDEVRRGRPEPCRRGAPIPRPSRKKKRRR